MRNPHLKLPFCHLAAKLWEVYVSRRGQVLQTILLSASLGLTSACNAVGQPTTSPATSPTPISMSLRDSGQCDLAKTSFNKHLAAWETWVSSIEFAASLSNKTTDARGFLQQIAAYDSIGIPLTTPEKAIVEDGLDAFIKAVGLNNYLQDLWSPSVELIPEQKAIYTSLVERYVDLDNAAAPQVPRVKPSVTAVKVFNAFPPYGNEVVKLLKYCPA